MKAGTFIFFQL